MPAEDEFHFVGGLKDYLAAAVHADTLVHPDIFSGKSGRNGAHGACEWAVAWTADADGFLSSYCNTVPTPDGGTHESGMRSAMLRGLEVSLLGAPAPGNAAGRRNTVAPTAEECISYGIPAFRLNGHSLVFFGAWANHCAFYPGSSNTLKKFRNELRNFQTSKGTLRFSPDKPMPVALVKKLLKARIAENNARANKNRRKP